MGFKPKVKQAKDGGFWYIEDSKSELEVTNRNNENQAAINRKIEADWQSPDEVSKLGNSKR